jgi:hypothetical protein
MNIPIKQITADIYLQKNGTGTPYDFGEAPSMLNLYAFSAATHHLRRPEDLPNLVAYLEDLSDLKIDGKATGKSKLSNYPGEIVCYQKGNVTGILTDISQLDSIIVLHGNENLSAFEIPYEGQTTQTLREFLLADAPSSNNFIVSTRFNAYLDRPLCELIASKEKIYTQIKFNINQNKDEDIGNIS